MTISRLETDKSDYKPGETATLTASGFAPGSEVTFDVEHVTDPGTDGVYGTLDDVIVDLGGRGHDPWTIKDGGKKDLDGLVNGQVVTTWFVHPDDSLGARFLLTATASDGWGASATFTDASPTTQSVPIDPVVSGSTLLTFEAYTTAGSTGTGLISSFVRLQAPQAESFESGYNTSGRPVQFDENTSPQFTYAITLSMVPLVSIDGQNYYQFNLDLNESDKDSGPLITLHNIKFFASDSPTLTSMDETSLLFPENDARLLYDMDGDGDVTVLLTDWNSGSGTGDYRVNVPVSVFSGVALGDYIYVYSEFGSKDGSGSPAEGGFEEWFVVRQSTASMTIDKVADPDQVADVAGEELSYTIAVTNTGNVALTGVTVSDPGATVLRLTDLSGNNDAILDVGEIWQYSATRVVSQDDLDANGGGDVDIDNTATADSDQTEPLSDSAEIPVLQTKSLAITKVASMQSVSAPGTVTYTYEVTNTGNAAISNVVVVDDNGTPMDAADDVTLEVDATGDLDGDGKLDVGEVWMYEYAFEVTQAMIDAGGTITNIVTANGDDVEEATDSESVDIFQTPSIHIEKITFASPTNQGDNIGGLAVGDPIKWIYTVTNTGNVSLTNVAVTDDNGTPGDTSDDFAATYVSGDASNDGVLDVAEAWIFEASGLAEPGRYVNLGGVSAETVVSGDEVTDFDESSYFIASGLIAPTNTTPYQYISGTYQTFQDYYASQGGDIQYGVKGGKISQANPGVFFYFTGASGDIVGADGDDSDALADQMTITIDQQRTMVDPLTGEVTPYLSPLNFSKSNFTAIQLYKVIDDGDGVVDAGDTLQVAKLARNSVTLNADGDLDISFTPDAVGSMYIISVKYSTAGVSGYQLPSGETVWPTVNYTFSTMIGSTLIETDEGGVDLAPKMSSTMNLAGAAGDGASSLREGQLKLAMKAAIAYWDAQGEDVSGLDEVSVSIDDLGDDNGSWVLGETMGNMIWVDDDAAGHGWSVGLGPVAPNRVDLFSVLVHELGHVLGMEDVDLGDGLEVGQRLLPESMEADSHLPLPAQLLGLVGMQMAATELPFV